MITTAYEKSLMHLKRFLEEYRPQLEQAMTAVKILQSANPESEEFSDALAMLHVSATVLEPYSAGMVEAIDRYTEDLPNSE